MISVRQTKVVSTHPSRMSVLGAPVLQHQCACGGSPGMTGECEACKSKKLLGKPLQPKLAVSEPGDIYEQEADRVAEQVTRMPVSGSDQPRDFATSGSWVQRTAATGDRAGGEVPPIVQSALASPGRSLDAATRAFFEPRFGHDFGQVRVHCDDRAAESARMVSAHAYTVGRNIVFGYGQFSAVRREGRRLLAHELTHVVQQESSAFAAPIQRQTFVGAPGTTAKDKDRPLNSAEGPLMPTNDPGGTIIPNTASQGQNCAGDSVGVNSWINWPDLGLEFKGVTLSGGVQGNWSKAVNFVPTGCTRVNCTGIDEWHTRCGSAEIELITFLYKWPVAAQRPDGTVIDGFQSDFHMIGRSGIPGGWHSKMDKREKVEDIRSPLQSLHNSYPHTKKPDRIIEKLCLCCDKSKVKTA